MKKILDMFLILTMVTSLLVGCGSDRTGSTGGTDGTDSQNEGVTIRIGGLKGPTSMGMVKLLEDAEKNITENKYEFTMAGSADELAPGLLKGDLDILAVPANLGSIMYNNSKGAVQMLAVNTLGILYIVEKGGGEIDSLKDLKGKTIYASGKGATPEYTLNYLLEKSGLTLGEDVIAEWKSEPTEVTAQMALEEESVAMLPQPYVTVAGNQLENLRIAVDLDEEWEKLDNGSAFVTAGLIVRTEFARENPEAVSKFLEEYMASTEYVNENVEEAGKLVEKYGIAKTAIAQEAIPYCNIVCVTGNEMKTMAEGYLSVLYEQNEASVGGKLPGEDFYRIEE